jgi:pyruvate kinase
MLKSMVDQSRPTRAEASDVANAVLDGADAVMLSEETAIGLHPVEAVRMMNRILLAVEREARPHEMRVPEEESSIPDVIGGLVAQAAEVVKPAAIIVVTRSGFSARMVSKHRPKAKILAISKSRRIQRRLLLYWGVKPLDVGWTEDRDELLIKAVKKALEKGLVNREDVIMTVSGSTLEAPGRTSTLAMLRVRDILSRARSLAP